MNRKEETNMSVVLKGSQKAVIVGQDWGPAVTKTIVKLEGKVKADSVSAEDFTVFETKESFNLQKVQQRILQSTLNLILKEKFLQHTPVMRAVKRQTTLSL